MTLGNLLRDRAHQLDISFTQKVVLKRPFISDSGEACVLDINCSCLLGDKASVGRLISMSQYSCTQKMVLKRQFISDNGEAPVFSFRSTGRQRICWVTELYESVKFHMKDDLEKAVHWWPWRRNSAHLLLGLPVDRVHWFYKIVLLRRWSWKGCSVLTLGYLLGDRVHWVYTIVLCGRWSRKSNSSVTYSLVKGFAHHIHCGGVLEGRALRVVVLVFQVLISDDFYFRRVWWSWKDWFSTISISKRCGVLERTDL